jgi:hypothetical protein
MLSMPYFKPLTSSFNLRKITLVYEVLTCAVSILVDMLSQMYELTPAGVTTSNALSENTTLKQ